MSRMLSRFAFTFLILAAFLFWEGYHLLTRTERPEVWRVVLYFVGAGMSAGIGVRGIRDRHRRMHDDPKD